MKLKFFLLFVFTCLFQIKAYAFEITNYINPYGKWHEVTVAFDDLNETGYVRCVIKKNGKPIAMREMFIKGVGTIEITTPDIRGTTASCQKL